MKLRAYPSSSSEEKEIFEAKRRKEKKRFYKVFCFLLISFAS
jgi:hypothetical protein